MPFAICSDEIETAVHRIAVNLDTDSNEMLESQWKSRDPNPPSPF
jgi:hypothetical protein